MSTTLPEEQEQEQEQATNEPAEEQKQAENKNGMKARPSNNKGRKYDMQERNYWFHLCRMFDDNLPKYRNKQSIFLNHSDSGSFLSNSNRYRNQFSRWYRKYKSGDLTLDEEGGKLRNRRGEYDDVGAKLVEYIQQHEQQQQQQHDDDNNKQVVPAPSTLSWQHLKTKAKEIAQELGKSQDFKASSGWLNVTLRKAGRLARPKKPPVTHLQAMEHLGELRRYCMEQQQSCHVDAVACCNKLDQLLRVVVHRHHHHDGTSKNGKRGAAKAKKHVRVQPSQQHVQQPPPVLQPLQPPQQQVLQPPPQVTTTMTTTIHPLSPVPVAQMVAAPILAGPVVPPNFLPPFYATNDDSPAPTAFRDGMNE